MKKNLLKAFLFIIILIILFIFGILIVDNKINKNKTNTSKKNTENINYNYKKPIVPNGFKKVETQSASWYTDKKR